MPFCLELAGFVWAKTSGDIGKSSEKKRFAVISGDSQTTSGADQIQKLLESHNKPDNCYADRLQVVIGSEKVALGFTIKHVRRVYITTPSWNIPLRSSFGAGFRFGSHAALKEEERYINIFRLVAVEKGKYAQNTGFPENAGFSKTKTSDIEIYELAEDKEYKNTQIYRLLKIASFDCAVTYKRNVLPEDVPNTKECDYMQCNYICDSFPSDIIDKTGKVYAYEIPEKDIDRSTYDLFYSNPKVEIYKKEIAKLFNNYFALKIDDVKQLVDIKDDEEFILLKAISHIIENRILIRNRYGFLCYLKEQDNILFLDNSTSSKPNYSETTYIENPLITEKTNMETLIDIFELKDDKKFIGTFCDDPTDENFNRFSYKTKIILLEAAAVSPKNAVVDTVLDNMKNKIKTMSDGVKIHVLYSDEYKGTSYDVAAKNIKVTGLMRYYDEEEQRWEYVKDRATEEKYVKELNSTKVKHYIESETGYSGWESSTDKKFRIVQKKGRGKDCKTFKSPELFKIFFDISYFPQIPAGEYKNLGKEDIITRIQAKYPEAENLSKRDIETLKKILYLTQMKKEELCEELKKWFRKNDLLKTD